ncbi:MAG TPA: glycosyltransferase family 4 protein [Blastocatellia bacterium]|nr:glycosyltransferase family 4 protein [Blastocatellia bacterium]
MQVIIKTSSSRSPARRQRVLIVSPHLTKTLGGITALVRELLASNLTHKYEFRHIASQADEYSQFGKVVLAVTAFIQYVWLIVRWRPEMVWIHVGGNASLYRKTPFIAFGRMTGRCVLTHFHAGDFTPYFKRQSRYGQRLILWGLGLSHRLITCSRELQGILNRHLPEADVVVLPNGVDVTEFATERRLREGAQAGEPVRLLFVGAMGRLKGERDLIEALRLAEARVPNLRVMMLGHGSETLMRLCEHRQVLHLLEYFGPAPMDRRAEFFKQADIFVLPTYAEGMPVSVIEAMAAGLPVITTPVGGIPELITDGVEGWLVRPGEIDALAERIVTLASDERMRLAMGKRAELRACRFDRHIIQARLSEAMQQTFSIAGRGRRGADGGSIQISVVTPEAVRGRNS